MNEPAPKIGGLLLPDADTALLQTCGNCRFKDRTPDVRTITCTGTPPTPILLGLQETPLGPQPVMQYVWPQLPRTTPGCGLWQNASRVIAN